jgi:predicted RND superfamily exporter protein
VLASGATAIAGFAVLAFSDIRMLQELGIVTVVDLSVSLLGVLAVLPAVLVLAERRAGRPRLRRARERSDPAVPA